MRGGAVFAALLSTVAAGVVAPRPVTLITFDVDGTLVQGSGSSDASAHSRAFAAALGAVLGSGTPTALPAELLPREKFHGSTDGLILLNMARAAFGTPAEVVAPQLGALWRAMYEYVAALPDEEVAKGIEPLPGVPLPARARARARAKARARARARVRVRDRASPCQGRAAPC